MKSFTSYNKELYRRSALLWYLVTSGLKADTRNTLLGYFWWILDPFLMVLVFLFVRVVFMGGIGEGAVPFLAVGLTAFKNFSAVLTGSARSITSKSSLITQVSLPKAIFPLSTVLTQLINYVFSLVTVAIILGFSGIIPGPEILWFPYILLVQTLFHFALGLFMAYVAAFVRDIENILRHITMILRFASPVIWETTRLGPNMQWIARVNPLAWLLNAYRDVLMYGRTPDIMLISIFGLASLVSIIVLLVFYTYNEHRIVKVL